MDKIIGFGGTYYTLWHVAYEITYAKTPDGRDYPIYETYQYIYVKNIAITLAKVLQLYPGVEINTSLRGTKTFTMRKEVDKEPHILKFGKYFGQDVRDVIKTDFDYVLYMIDKYGDDHPTFKVAMQTPEYIAYTDNLRAAAVAQLEGLQPLTDGCHTLKIERNPNEEGLAYVTIAPGHTLGLQFNAVKEYFYDGRTYYLPIFKDGKARRIKGKEVNYELQILETNADATTGTMHQVARVLN